MKPQLLRPRRRFLHQRSWTGRGEGEWSRRLDSNPQPPVYKTGALPIELRQHDRMGTNEDWSRPGQPGAGTLAYGWQPRKQDKSQEDDFRTPVLPVPRGREEWECETGRVVRTDGRRSQARFIELPRGPGVGRRARGGAHGPTRDIEGASGFEGGRPARSPAGAAERRRAPSRPCWVLRLRASSRSPLLHRPRPSSS